MITLTAKAADVVRDDIRKGQLPAHTALRLGVVNDGCKDSGTQYRYVLELDSEAVGPGDQLFESQGIQIRVDRPSLQHLDGVQLGVKQGPHGSEYMFLNPNAQNSCSCGNTFSEAMPDIEVKQAEAH
ncbi:MAG: iron-sulfur cluster assembly accessory protein [Edaphobacter sp.]